MKKSNKKEFINISQEPATFENLENVFVVIHPRDNDNPISNSGTWVRETELSQSTLKDAISLANILEDRFGGSYIAKLSECDESIFNEPEHCNEDEILMITENGGVDDGPIVWEKCGSRLPYRAFSKPNRYGKIKFLKVEKHLKYDDLFWEKVENGFFNK